MSVTVRQACREDLPDIIAIEEASFSVPWSHQSLAAELDNPVARYYVLEKEDGSVAGYADVWLIADEASWPTSPSIRQHGAWAMARFSCERPWKPSSGKAARVSSWKSANPMRRPRACTASWAMKPLPSARTIIPSLWKMRVSCIVKKRSINGSAIHYRKKDEIYVYLSFRNEL